MGTGAMDIGEFEALIDSRGEDIAQWPSLRQDAAFELLSSSAEAREVLRQARVVRLGLRANATVKAPAGLADRIVARATGTDLAPPTVPAGAEDKVGEQVEIGEAGTEGGALRRAKIFLPVCLLVGLASGVYVSDMTDMVGQIDFPTLLIHLMN
jgi:hypothetical protein